MFPIPELLYTAILNVKTSQLQINVLLELMQVIYRFLVLQIELRFSQEYLHQTQCQICFGLINLLFLFLSSAQL